ncbi:MAG: hypothetical protein ACLP00_27805 [Terracidiphilus sp.]
MAHDPHASPGLLFALEVYKHYFRLMRTANAGLRYVLDRPASQESDGDPSLGGKLLWAAGLDAESRALVVAGHIAGAATLTATANVDAQKQAIRDGVVDFLVTSLDEALRILKNEIRKRQSVAVCVGAVPKLIESEMMERGVRPDLSREGLTSVAEGEKALRGPANHPELDPIDAKTLIVWRVDAAPAQWLPKLDALALDCLDVEDWVARRWLRLGGRSMGRLGQGAHLLISNREFAARMIERTREHVLRGEIKVRGQIQVSFEGGNEEYDFQPPGTNQAD